MSKGDGFRPDFTSFVQILMDFFSGLELDFQRVLNKLESSLTQCFERV
jgi:hypothetical protein